MLGDLFNRAVSYAQYLLGTDTVEEKQPAQESPTSASPGSMKKQRRNPSLTISTDWRSASQHQISQALVFCHPAKSEAVESCLALALGDDNLFDGLPSPHRDAARKSYQAACDSTLAVHGNFLNTLATPLSSRKTFEELLAVESPEQLQKFVR